MGIQSSYLLVQFIQWNYSSTGTDGFIGLGVVHGVFVQRPVCMRVFIYTYGIELTWQDVLTFRSFNESVEYGK